MFKFVLNFAAAIVLIVFSGCLFAQVPGQEAESDLEMKRIQNVISVINGEIKSDLDQLLILQEALKANSRMSLEAQGRSPDIVNIADIAAAQRQAVERETSINARIDSVLARTAELSARKQVLLEQFMELSAAPISSTANSSK